MNTNVDLRQLAVRRDEPLAPSLRRPRHVLGRYLLPSLVIAGFLAVVAWAARESLLPSKPVTVVPVLTARTEISQAGTPLFQTAGWVEPRPTPVIVTALAEGVIDKLLVVEGQEVKAGEPVALLIDADAKLAVQAAQADVRLRKAEVIGAKATFQAAKTNAEIPVHLEAALAEADAMLAQKETELSNLPFQRKTADRRFELARTVFGNIDKLFSSGASSMTRWLEADNELKASTVLVEELKTRETTITREVKALTAKVAAVRKRLELKTEEIRQFADAEAQLEVAEARLEQAQSNLEIAQLRLERMVVRAPSAGRVLSLMARPGMRLMGLAPASLYDASTVVTLYDPAMLQVRADVRLEDVPRVQPGQAVKIETPAAPDGPVDGVVLFTTSLADIQKNTLQVKVAIMNPPATLRADMLVQVTFLANATPKVKATDAEPLRLLIPRQLVETGEGGARVWIADQAAGVARLRAIKLGVMAGELVEVIGGLTPADRLISGGREGLSEGQRITVMGEDTGGLQQGIVSLPGRVIEHSGGHNQEKH
jgi:RND family efflux transporter MFP subunit